MLFFCLSILVLALPAVSAQELSERSHDTRRRLHVFQQLADEPTGNERKLLRISDDADSEKSSGRSFEMKTSKDERTQRRAFVATFPLGQGCVLQIRSVPSDQVLAIRFIGKCGSLIDASTANPLSNDDRAFLQNVANTLEADESMDTDTVESDASQTARIAQLLHDWPETLSLEYELDIEEKIERLQKRYEEDLEHMVPKEHPSVSGGRQLRHSHTAHNIRDPPEVSIDPETGRRRLAYTTLCDRMNTWVATTHDDWDYGRWNDRTTYYAFVAPFPPCSDTSGTWFWKDNRWQCYEPDHDPNVEFAYGECFGRCGAGCGDSGKGTYTYACLDHDSCVRFGHSLASFWCNDEFLATIDDYTFAPRCIR